MLLDKPSEVTVMLVILANMANCYCRRGYLIDEGINHFPQSSILNPQSIMYSLLHVDTSLTPDIRDHHIPRTANRQTLRQTQLPSSQNQERAGISLMQSIPSTMTIYITPITATHLLPSRYCTASSLKDPPIRCYEFNLFYSNKTSPEL